MSPAFANTARPLQITKTPAVTMGPVVTVPNSKTALPQQELLTTAGTTPALPSTSQSDVTFRQPATENKPVTLFTSSKPSEQHPTLMVTTATSKSSQSSRRTSIPPVPSDAPSSADSSPSHSVPPLSTSAATFHTRFGRTSKHATKNSPRMFGVKCAVDFERIYRYLSEIHKPNEECHLTPMGESHLTRNGVIAQKTW